MKIKPIIATLILLIACSFCFASEPIKKKEGRERCVREILSKMSLRQMVGQLIMIGCDTECDAKYVGKILKDIDSNKVGGVCFFKGRAENLPTLIAKYNSVGSVPLLVSVDGEWGLAMRMTDVTPFVRQMTLGALDTADYDLVYRMGRLIGQQCRTLGIHINFAPDVDINLNPANPVINTRSFGQDKQRVALLGEKYALGLQSEGVMAVVKHFPGHGDTEVDSHKALPTINHDKSFIDSVDIFPFRHTIEKGAWGAMVGHLNVPSLSARDSLPACINPDIVSDYLVDELNFKGLVFTDAMNMKGLTNDFPDGEAQVLALLAGVDVLLMPESTDAAMNAILEAVKQGRIKEKLIKEKCRKVLRWKYDMGLIGQRGEKKAVNSLSAEKKQTTKKQIADFNSKIKALNLEIARSVTTIVRNDEDFLPLEISDSAVVAVVSLNKAGFSSFSETASKFHRIETYILDDKAPQAAADSVLSSLERADVVITLASGGVNQTKKDNYGVSAGDLNHISQIQSLGKKNALVLFANPYVLSSLDTLCDYNALVLAYQNTAELQQSAAEGLFGNSPFKGTLPVCGSENYPMQHLFLDADPDKGYAAVMEAGLKRECFEKIDSILENGIAQGAYPGAQVLIAKDGNVVFERSVGFQTYEKREPITDSSVFDLASLTKVMATTLAVMKLYEEGAFSLDDRLSQYLPYLKKTNKSKITIREALSHTARLKAFIPFWKQSLEDAKKNPSLYASDKADDTNYVQVSDNLFILRSYKDEIRKQIAASSLGEKHRYVYSDLGFILLGDLVESVSGKALDYYVEETFYRPLGLEHTGFRPIARGVDIKDIVPTIEAVDFRACRLQGYVHDEASALNGGVAGHAGLFSSARELFVLCQMLLNGGEYGGNRYLETETIETFNTRYYKKHSNRRALGFDKPLIASHSQHCSKYCSQESFGHSGFTGTFLWIDPVNNTVYIFLSNRVYPDASSNKLAQLNIRTDIQDLIYLAGQEDGSDEETEE